MPIGRTIPPASAPLGIKDLFRGLKGLARGSNEVERFRSELKEYFGVRHCFLVSSGKAALTQILLALHDLQPQRNEVLIPAFCCYSVPSAVKRTGLKIRLCDSDVQTLDYDYSRLSGGAGSTGKLLAAVSVHLFGLAADTGRLRNAISEPGAAIVEDAAQALGAESQGRKQGLVGDVGFFSLGRGKALSTVEGGIVVTQRDDIADRLRHRLSDLTEYSPMELLLLIVQALALVVFQRPALFWIPKMLPFLKVGDTLYDPFFRQRKLSGFQAGLARGWCARLERYRRLRRRSVDRWSKLTLPAGVVHYAQRQEPTIDFIRYPLCVEDERLWAWTLARSAEGGHGVMSTYPDAVSGILELKDHFDGNQYPVAEYLSRRLLTLPVHPLLSERDRRKIELLMKEVGTQSLLQRKTAAYEDGQGGISS